MAMARKRKGMKLDQALKLYICLYCVCFLLTWMISVPMLIHVTPQSECLLFVTPYIKFGPAAACTFVGCAPIIVAAATVLLIVLHVMQLRSLKAFLRKPGPHSSKYHSRPTHIFWRMVIFHGSVTMVVLIVASIVTAGYVTTCENLQRDVLNTVRKRIETGSYGGGKARQENYDVFADDRSINRYTNDYKNSWGRDSFEAGVTCRNILTDPEIHSQLKQNHAENPYYKHYYGFWYKSEVADVGNIRYFTYRNNMILEMAMAGSWISFAIWFAVLILMLKERHHIKAHLTDESMWGSEFGGASRRSVASRNSNQSFDKMSGRYSNQSGSRYSRPRQADTSNYRTPIVRTQPPPLMTQSSLMNYFANDGEEMPMNPGMMGNDEVDPIHHENSNSFGDMNTQDLSFEISDIPIGQDLTMENEPFPMGDIVSQSQIPIETDALFNPRGGRSSQQPRVTGRRGGRNSSGGQSPQQRRPQQQQQQRQQQLQRPPSANSRKISNNSATNRPYGYKTQLGAQSMI